MRFKNIFFLLILAPVLSGCVRFSLEKLQKVEFSGTPFQTALAKEYRNFSEKEAGEYDWVDAEYFAKKGLQAAAGMDVALESVENWEISPSLQSTLTEAREQLLSLVSEEIKQKEPEIAARAIFLFDCWLEQQEENWQTEHIEACRNEFFDVLDYLSVADGRKTISDIEPEKFEPVIQQKSEEVKSSPITKQGSEKHPGESATSSYVVFFDFDSTKLDKDAKNTINAVVKDLNNESSYAVILNGYTDSFGDEKYNIALSERRASAVKKSLVEKGIVKDSIAVYSFGEKEPKVPTPDGQKEKSNRRVEIYIH